MGEWPGESLGRQFGWLWAAYAVSAYGTGLGFGAFPLIAILVLHSGPAEVSALAAAGLAVGALVAVPLGPWVEFRRKRPVMIAMDLIRFAAMMSIPAAFALGWLSFVQLLVVSVVVAAAKIAFNAASGAYLKALVRPEDLLVANGRFESTTWSAIVLGPPLGGAAIGLFGPVTTVLADAVSYLLSALGIRAIGRREPRPQRTGAAAAAGRRPARRLAAHPDPPGAAAAVLQPMLVNGLIMATEPLLAVLMLGRLGFAPWQYGLAFAAPCVGGLIGSRLARRLVARFGQHRVMLTAGALRALLAGRPGLHPARRRRHRARDRRELGAGHQHRRVQPGAGHLPARAHGHRPRLPHPVRLVGQQQRHHRGPDRAVGRARQPHRPAHRHRGRRGAAPGHPARATPPRPRYPGDSARAGSSPARSRSIDRIPAGRRQGGHSRSCSGWVLV